MGRIFRQDGPFLLNAISTLGGVTWAWSSSVAIYFLFLLLLLALQPEKRNAFPVDQRWKMAAAIVTVAAAGVAIQRSANNVIRRRKLRSLSGPIQPVSESPPSSLSGFWPQVKKGLIAFCLWLVGVSVLFSLLAWLWVVVQAVSGLMKLGWLGIAGGFLAASGVIGRTVSVRRKLETSKEPLWVQSELQEPQSQIEPAEEPAETTDVLRYHSKLQDESAGGNGDMPIALGLTVCSFLMLSTAWTAITVNRFNFFYRLMVAFVSVGLAMFLAKAAWRRYKLGFMWMDRERVKNEKMQAERKLQKMKAKNLLQSAKHLPD